MTLLKETPPDTGPRGSGPAGADGPWRNIGSAACSDDQERLRDPDVRGSSVSTRSPSLDRRAGRAINAPPRSSAKPAASSRRAEEIAYQCQTGVRIVAHRYIDIAGRQAHAAQPDWQPESPVILAGSVPIQAREGLRPRRKGPVISEGQDSGGIRAGMSIRASKNGGRHQVLAGLLPPFAPLRGPETHPARSDFRFPTARRRRRTPLPLLSTPERLPKVR